MEFKEAILNYAEQPINRQLLQSLLVGYKRPYDKINELVKQGILIPVKAGIYVPGKNVNIAGPETFLLANHIFGPSYISMDSALAYWGLIPEKVFETTSATSKHYKENKTSVGKFSYAHLPLPYYSFGIKMMALTPKQIVLIASPEKALCDKIITTSGLLLRSVKQVKELLMEDWRIEKDVLRNLNNKEISTWIIDAPKSTSIDMLVQTLQLL